MRRSDGGADPVSNGGNTWHFKLDGIFAASPAGLTLAQVKALVEPTRPDQVAAAGAAFQRAAQRLTQIAGQLAMHAGTLAAAWGGANAPTVLGQLQQLQETAVGLANTSQGTGSVLEWYGGTILPFYKAQIQSMTDTAADKIAGYLTGTDPANAAAAGQLASLNTRIIEAFTAMPPVASKNLPPMTGSFGAPGPSGGSGGGRSAVGGYVAAPPASAGATTLPPAVGGPVIGHGTLAGVSPPAGGGASASGVPSGGTGVGGPGAGGAVGGQGVPGPVVSGPIIGGQQALASGLPGQRPAATDPAAAEPSAAEPVVGEPVITSRTLGVLGGDSALPPGGREVADGAAANKLGVAADPAAGDAAVGDAAAADAAGGRAFMPMGMGGGQPGSEHEHRTWLTEDRDIWADPARVTPAIIG